MISDPCFPGPVTYNFPQPTGNYDKKMFPHAIKIKIHYDEKSFSHIDLASIVLINLRL